MSQHLQPSCSNQSRVYVLVGSIHVSSVSAKQLKDTAVSISCGGTRTLAHGCTVVSFLCFIFFFLGGGAVQGLHCRCLGTFLVAECDIAAPQNVGIRSPWWQVVV